MKILTERGYSFTTIGKNKSNIFSGRNQKNVCTHVNYTYSWDSRVRFEGPCQDNPESTVYTGRTALTPDGPDTGPQTWRGNLMNTAYSISFRKCFSWMGNCLWHKGDVMLRSFRFWTRDGEGSQQHFAGEIIRVSRWSSDHYQKWAIQMSRGPLPALFHRSGVVRNSWDHLQLDYESATSISGKIFTPTSFWRGALPCSQALLIVCRNKSLHWLQGSVILFIWKKLKKSNGMVHKSLTIWTSICFYWVNKRF